MTKLVWLQSSLVDSGSASLCSSSANPCLLSSTPWSALRHRLSAGALVGGYRSGSSQRIEPLRSPTLVITLVPLARKSSYVRHYLIGHPLPWILFPCAGEPRYSNPGGSDPGLGDMLSHSSWVLLTVRLHLAWILGGRSCATRCDDGLPLNTLPGRPRVVMAPAIRLS